MLYTIQVSNEPRRGTEQWQTVYDGPIATRRDARDACNNMRLWYRNVRSFAGRGTIGRLWFEYYGNPFAEGHGNVE